MTLLIVEVPLVELVDKASQGAASVKARGCHLHEFGKGELVIGHVRLPDEDAKFRTHNRVALAQRREDFSLQHERSVRLSPIIHRQEPELLQVNKSWEDVSCQTRDLGQLFINVEMKDLYLGVWERRVWYFDPSDPSIIVISVEEKPGRRLSVISCPMDRLFEKGELHEG